MATLSVQKISLTGLGPAFVSASEGGDEFANSGRVFLHVKNGHTSDQTVTVNSLRICDLGYDHDAIVTVPAGEERLIGPFPRFRFNDPNGKVQVSYSGVTALTIAAIELE